MANKKMGFEGQLLYGEPGSTGSTLLTNVTDISITTDKEKGKTTKRGDGSAPPVETESVTVRKWSCEWTMLHDITDTALEALRVAEASGTAVALRMLDHAAGKGFDGDVTLSMADGRPLNGEATLKFTATPNDDYGRDPQLYV